MALTRFRREKTHGTVSSPASFVVKHPFFESFRSRRDSFHRTELDAKTGFDDVCLGLAKQGAFKDANMPNTIRCFCCDFAPVVRNSSFLKELGSYELHKIYNTSVGCLCASWEIFKHFRTTDVKITAKINHASATEFYYAKFFLWGKFICKSNYISWLRCFKIR